MKFIQLNFQRRRFSHLRGVDHLDSTNFGSSRSFLIFVSSSSTTGKTAVLLVAFAVDITDCIILVTLLTNIINHWPTFTTYLFPSRSYSAVLLTNPEVEIRWHVTAFTTTCSKIIDSNGVQIQSKDYVANEIGEPWGGGIHMFPSRTLKMGRIKRP
jgi:hypothetical protein